MYQPSAFIEQRVEILHKLIRAHPLATLITSGRGGLLANLVPFTLVESGERGTLRAHVAKANDQVARSSRSDLELCRRTGSRGAARH